MGLILAVNLRGKINSQSGVRKTLGELKLERKFTATVVTDDAPTVGMLRSCKDFIAWSQVDKDLLSALLEKRGMVSESKRLDAPALSKLGFKTYGDMEAKILSEGNNLSTVSGIRPFFRLSPPRGGFKFPTRRQASERGSLGSNPKLPDIVRRML